MSMKNIRYLLIGSVETKEEIGSFPEKGVEEKIKTDYFEFFKHFVRRKKIIEIK